MDPMNIDTSLAIVVAEAASAARGGRWTVLRVLYLGDTGPGGRAWLAEVEARSNLGNERTKTRRMNSASLERALELIDDSDMGIAVKAAAREYCEDHGLPIRKPGRQQVPTDPKAALAWLYGLAVGETLSLNAAAADLGTNESTMRAAIAAGREIKVPLLALLPFVDRIAWQDFIAREREKAA
jgi:hypothetical protein